VQEDNVESFIQDSRYGLRMLVKARGFAALAVFTLAPGVGANTAMFSIVNSWLLRPLPLKDPQHLAGVWRTRSQAPRQPAFNLYHDYVVMASQNHTFQSLAATFEQRYALTGTEGRPEKVHGAVASWNLFQTVGATPAIGRLFEGRDQHGEPACVISHALWTARFHGASDIVGRTM
jgi:hypothetical protein